MAAGKLLAPEIDSMTFMMSKEGYLGDGPHGPWHPHVMFFMPPSVQAKDWGADLARTRVFGADAGVDTYTMFYVPVSTWSDGTPGEKSRVKHSMCRSIPSKSTDA